MRNEYQRDDEPCRAADSHAGEFDGFVIYWCPLDKCWRIDFLDWRIKPIGPFATSQEAFCNMKAAIDTMIAARKEE